MRTRCPTCGRMQQRSIAANKRYWALMGLIAERLKVDGQHYSDKIWHEYMKRRFLGAEEYRLPSGDIMVVPNSSSDLDEDTFSDYLTKVEHWALERNVWLPDKEGT